MTKERQVTKKLNEDHSKIDVIWNLSQECPWYCNICAVSARPIGSLRNSSELTLDEKKDVLGMLAVGFSEIDFSGGDPLHREEDLLLVEEAVRTCPQGTISVSTTGAQFDDKRLEICKKAKIVEFTLDALPGIKNPARPSRYAEASARAIRRCVLAGKRTRAVTPLFPLTMRKENLMEVYDFFCESGCQEWELLRYYPVGRGKRFLESIPTNDDYKRVMDFVDSFKGSTKVIYQHSLTLLRNEGRCPAVHESIGILPDGSVVACAWALDGDMNPIGEFYLGKIPEESLEDVIRRARQKVEFQQRVDYCRVLAFLGNDVD